jgi:arylsulfatase
MIEQIDEQFGRILTAIEATGQAENTVVLFTSDHGEMLGDHGLMQKGCRFYDGLTRVPMIWSAPGRFAARRSADLVELTDIAPTLLDLAGVNVPQEMQGKSLLPLLSSEDHPTHRQFVRTEYLNALWHDPAGPRRTSHATMYHDARWKLVIYHSHGLGELYDLAEDPGEFHSLWDDPGYARSKAELIQRSFDATVMAADQGPPVAVL